MNAAPGVASPASRSTPTASDGPPHRAFLFDANRCTGCAACSLACSTENALGWGVSWRQIVTFNPERRPGVPSFHLSLACNHCDDAPCVVHCPTGAMHRDDLTGAVLVDEARCIGCRYCAWVCPYDAPRFDGARGVMTKCTLCGHRLAAGGTPACVEACPTGALEHGPPAGTERLPGFPDAPAGPRIRFTPLRRGATPPQSTWSLPAEVLAAYGPAATTDGSATTTQEMRAVHSTTPIRGFGPSPVSLTFRGEWPLWLFTSGLAGLVGWIGAALVRPSLSVPLPAFAALSALLLGSSTLHLGRPLRAWRTLANVRSSALSREIAAVGAFLAATTLWLAWGGAGGARLIPVTPPAHALALLGGAAMALGLVALVAVDRVYPPVRGDRSLDPADTFLTALLWTTALLRMGWLFAALAALKLVAALRRPSRSPATVAMRAVALAGPLMLWGLAPGGGNGWALLLVGVVELTDRARFYGALAIPGPRAAARRDAARWPIRAAESSEP